MPCIRGPWRLNVDLMLANNSCWGERWRPQFRGAAYDFTNSPTLLSLSAHLGSGKFGLVTGVGHQSPNRADRALEHVLANVRASSLSTGPGRHRDPVLRFEGVGPARTLTVPRPWRDIVICQAPGRYNRQRNASGDLRHFGGSRVGLPIGRPGSGGFFPCSSGIRRGSRRRCQ